MAKAYAQFRIYVGRSRTLQELPFSFLGSGEPLKVPSQRSDVSRSLVGEDLFAVVRGVGGRRER